MIVDFSKMTIYELFALILAFVALIIPFIQWIYRKWLIKPILKHLPNGKVNLFINRSGSYIRLDGVFEAKNKPISIKNVAVKVLRNKDGLALNLRWSVFNSPINQRVIDLYTSTTEIAHPFHIEADSVACAFIEFTDFFDASGKTFTPFYDELVKEALMPKQLGISYQDAFPKYRSSQSYNEAKRALEKELFWEIGKYDIALEAEYGKQKVSFNYQFNINAEENEQLKNNLLETLVAPLKSAYGVPLSFQNVQAELTNK